MIIAAYQPWLQHVGVSCSSPFQVLCWGSSSSLGFAQEPIQLVLQGHPKCGNPGTFSKSCLWQFCCTHSIVTWFFFFLLAKERLVALNLEKHPIPLTRREVLLFFWLDHTNCDRLHILNCTPRIGLDSWCTKLLIRVVHSEFYSQNRVTLLMYKTAD